MSDVNETRLAHITRDVLERAIPFDQFLAGIAARLRDVPAEHPGLEMGDTDVESFMFGGSVCRVPTFAGRECLQPGPAVKASDFAAALDRIRGRVQTVEEQESLLRVLGLTLAQLRDAKPSDQH